MLAIVDLAFAFFQSWFFFPREDCGCPLFLGSYLVLSSISMSLSLSFLIGQGVEKRKGVLKEDSSSLNYIYI